MYDLVVSRLASFGYDLQLGDQQKIEYSIALVSEYIKNFCNIYSDLPERLKYYTVDKICGDFLKSKLLTGNLQFADINFSFAVDKSQTPAQMLTSFIDNLLAFDKNILYRFRRLEW